MKEFQNPNPEQSLTLDEVEKRIRDFRLKPSLTIEEENQWRNLMTLRKDLLSKQK